MTSRGKRMSQNRKEDGMAEVVVIGGGPGGYVAAMKLAMNGKKTILVERDQIGGTCLNRGCIPTKALMHCSEVLETIRHSERSGICVDSWHVDRQKVDAYKNEVVEKLSGGVAWLLKKRGVQVIRGTAVFTGERQLKITLPGGEEQYLSPQWVIIATGSESALPPIEGINGKHVMTSTEALDVTDLPQNLVIIGGGVIGLEIGSIYSRFGVKTTILEALPELLPSADREAVQVLQDAVGRTIQIQTGAKVNAIRDFGDEKKVCYEVDGTAREITAQKVLVCVGRKPNTRELGLDRAGVAVSDRGYILVNECCETTAKHVYAIGDVNGRTLLAHAASAQGILVSEKICGRDAEVNINLIPSCIYTRPELAYVGKTEEDLKKAHIPYRVGRFPLNANGKALSMDEPEGFVKILIGKPYGEILGAHLVGARATDLIAELALAINAECTVEELIHTVHAHPTISEAVFEAAELAYFGQTVHVI